MYIVSWNQNKLWRYSRSIVNKTHHSSVIIIITITAYHCSLFIRLSLHVTVQIWRTVHTAGENFIKYAIPIPIRTIPITISSPKLLPVSHSIPMHTSTVCRIQSQTSTKTATVKAQNAMWYVLRRAARRSNASCRLRSIRCCCSTLRVCQQTASTCYSNLSLHFTLSLHVIPQPHLHSFKSVNKQHQHATVLSHFISPYHSTWYHNHTSTASSLSTNSINMLQQSHTSFHLITPRGTTTTPPQCQVCSSCSPSLWHTSYNTPHKSLTTV